MLLASKKVGASGFVGLPLRPLYPGSRRQSRVAADGR
jgi:hypothetical protein